MSDTKQKTPDQFMSLNEIREWIEKADHILIYLPFYREYRPEGEEPGPVRGSYCEIGKKHVREFFRLVSEAKSGSWRICANVRLKEEGESQDTLYIGDFNELME